MRARWGLDAPRALHRQLHDALQQMHTSAKIWLPVNQAEADAKWSVPIDLRRNKSADRPAHFSRCWLEIATRLPLM